MGDFDREEQQNQAAEPAFEGGDPAPAAAQSAEAGVESAGVASPDASSLFMGQYGGPALQLDPSLAAVPDPLPRFQLEEPNPDLAQAAKTYRDPSESAPAGSVLPTRDLTGGDARAPGPSGDQSLAGKAADWWNRKVGEAQQGGEPDRPQNPTTSSPSEGRIPTDPRGTYKGNLPGFPF